MKWSDQHYPTDTIPYSYVMCETPLGTCTIEWKGWKVDPDYVIHIGRKYVGTKYSLEEAKQVAQQHLEKKYEELKQFLNK